MFHRVFVATCLAASVSAASFDWTMGNLTLYHSQNSYCDVNSYETRVYKGLLEGFVPTFTINDPSHDTHGYIGYHAGQQTIYVSFRGSESIKNWVDNLDAILTNYPLCTKCEVHKGFYKAEQSCFADVLFVVQTLKAKYPNYSVVLTGHSLGAALATLTAMDLVKAGVSNVKLFNFGSPRVGNTNFANFADTYLTSHSRVTHHKDMVPHTPMHERFTHIDNEWYQPRDDNYVQECIGNEDSNCSYQWHVTSIEDHLFYFGLHLGEGTAECAPFL